MQKNTPALLADSNIIASNKGNGIVILNFSNQNTIQNNAIGTDSTGTVPLGNSGDGIFVELNSSNNTIGSLDSSKGNIIAYNNKGVVIGDDTQDLSTGNAILSNAIFANGTIGIDLADDGRTPNHLFNPTPGPNNFQNFPVICSAVIGKNKSTIAGKLHSRPNSLYMIQFFNNSTKENEGRTFVGQVLVLTNSAGNASFSACVAKVCNDTFVTATATLLINSGNSFIPSDTSEFSNPIQTKSKK